jgi:hypothetical protein
MLISIEGNFQNTADTTSDVAAGRTCNNPPTLPHAQIPKNPTGIMPPTMCKASTCLSGMPQSNAFANTTRHPAPRCCPRKHTRPSSCRCLGCPCPSPGTPCRRKDGKIRGKTENNVHCRVAKGLIPRSGSRLAKSGPRAHIQILSIDGTCTSPIQDIRNVASGVDGRVRRVEGISPFDQALDTLLQVRGRNREFQEFEELRDEESMREALAGLHHADDCGINLQASNARSANDALSCHCRECMRLQFCGRPARCLQESASTENSKGFAQIARRGAPWQRELSRQEGLGRAPEKDSTF